MFNKIIYLFQLEWLKWKKHRVFLIFVLFFSVLLPGILLSAKNLPDIENPIHISNEVFFMFPTIWIFIAYIGNWLAFFLLGYLGVVIVTTEYQNKTLRQSIMSGVSRADFLWGKLVFAAGISLAATFYMILCGLVIGYLNTDVVISSKLWEHADLFPRFWLMCFGYMSFGMLVGFLIKRTALSLMLYLGYIAMIEPVFRWAFHNKYFPGVSMNFYPINSIEELIPIPYLDVLNKYGNDTAFDYIVPPMQATIAALIFIAIFISLMKMRIEKSDL